MTSTRTDDVRKAVNTAVEQLRTPLLAAIGAGNLAGQALADAVEKARTRVNESGEAARKNIEELPGEVTSLREKLDPAELRKLVDEYTEAALKLYGKLAESGEEAWGKFVAEPRVKTVLEQVEDALQQVQDRAGEFGTEARERVEDVLGLVAKKTRTGGEKVAEAADEAAEKIVDAEVVVEEKTTPKSTPAAKPASTPRRTTATAKKPATGGTTTPKTTK
ncbi:hypothetical protein FPZ12_006490 [Amycolatopsis acidicola]|uniref:Heparin-binding hemagglutinin n=1 Tax=Amycolatopsis acidicola TaxID=2596893 RepID=A0A5N0VHJ1_9PSEU|nr:hypothetical protein [Amycolatopsis acidicola]KAA9164904.1 hypothetical protein FPZ12_006490 [Amycolatopsis acidicola]